VNGCSASTTEFEIFSAASTPSVVSYLCKTRRPSARSFVIEKKKYMEKEREREERRTRGKKKKNVV
jgi:Tfp pilus assembly protein PilE